MPELVDSHLQSGRIVDVLADLDAEGDLALGTLAQTREEIIFLSAPKQRWPKVLQVFVD